MAEDGSVETGGKGKRGRLILIGLALLFMGPLALAWMMYFSGSIGHPEGRVNHGVLLDPAHPLPELELEYLAGEAPEGEDLRRRWFMIQNYPDGCHADCAEAVYRTRQIWLALGRRAERVQRVLIVPELPMRSEEFLTSHQDLLVVDAGSDAGRRLVSTLGGADVERAEVFLVDPLGNLVMVYPSDYENEGLLEDIERLLKLSRVG